MLLYLLPKCLQIAACRHPPPTATTRASGEAGGHNAWCPKAGEVLAKPVRTISSTRDFQGIKGLSRKKSLHRRSRASSSSPLRN